MRSRPKFSSKVFFSIRDDHFSLYLAFALLSAWTLVMASIQRLLPDAGSTGVPDAVHAYRIVKNALLAVLIALQWIVQTGAVLFLVESNPGQRTIMRRLFLRCAALAFVLLIPWIISLALGKVFIGEMIDEGLLMIFFSVGLYWSRTNRRARPMLKFWSGYFLFFHSLFFFMYALAGFLPDTAAANCSYVFIDGAYYITYPLLLIFVIRYDSSYWSQHGALIMDMHTILSSEAEDLSTRFPSMIGGIPFIHFGSLDIKEKIGSGAFSEVFRAKWSESDVAVKVFRISAGQLETMNELLKEAKLMYSLRHPNVLRLLGLSMRGKQHKSSSHDAVDDFEPSSRDVEDGALLDVKDRDVVLCTVLRFCENGNLFFKVNRVRDIFLWPLRMKILHQTVAGMAYLHEHGVVHRDLKSPNILLSAQDDALISDFGLSRGNVAEGFHTMSAIGTPHYMAPEVLRGERYSKVADVWSFGVILFEVCCRKIPYENLAGLLIMQRVAHEGLRLVMDGNSEVPEFLVQMMERCFQEPEHRPTFAELEKELMGQKGRMW